MMKLLRTRRRGPQQIDLFAGGPRATGGHAGLVTLIALMTRLILDHADKNRLGSTAEAGHDL